MSFLKGFSVAILSLLLFLSLLIFGMAFTLNSTILNPDFVVAEIGKLDVSALVRESFAEEGPGGGTQGEFQDAMIDTVTRLEPVVKEQASAAIYPIYDYLLGKKESPELALMLRGTFANSDFVASLMDGLDMSSLVGEILKEQLAGQVPEDIAFLVEALDDALDDAIAEIEPVIKAELVAAADPILDYLLGENQGFNVEISLEQVVESLREPLKEAVLESLPLAFIGLSQGDIDQYFDEYFAEFTKIIPATIELDETIIGPEVPAQIAEALAEAEGALAEARPYVGYFQTAFYVLIGFMIILIAGIILIRRNVRGASRGLGITFLIYGALQLAGVFVLRNFLPTGLPLQDVPSSVQPWLVGLLGDFVAPLQAFSIGLLVVGAALIVVSVLYRRQRAEEEEANNLP